MPGVWQNNHESTYFQVTGMAQQGIVRGVKPDLRLSPITHFWLQQEIFGCNSFTCFFFCCFFFAFPSYMYISGVHHFWVRFLHMWPFFNPTIKVVTFRLRGWCVLGVFFVAGIHPSRTWTSGSFESVRWNAYMHRLDLGLYSHPKEFLGEWSLNPC